MHADKIAKTILSDMERRYKHKDSNSGICNSTLMFFGIHLSDAISEYVFCL